MLNKIINKFIDNLLVLFKPNKNTKMIAIILSSIMFIWSGIDKVSNFDKKVNTLVKKTSWPVWFSTFGMILVILLEIVGFIILVDYFSKSNILTPVLSKIVDQEKLVKFILLSLLGFIALVTIIYHPPGAGKMIPFLSNTTIFGLFLYVYADMK